MSSQEQRAARLGLDGPFPHPEVYVGGVGVEPGMGPCRVVIEAVDAAERLDGGPDEVGHRLVAANVADDAQGLAAGGGDLFGDRGRTVEGHVADRDGRPFGGQAERGGPPDVRGASAEQHHLAVELTHGSARPPSGRGARHTAPGARTSWASMLRHARCRRPDQELQPGGRRHRIGCTGRRHGSIVPCGCSAPSGSSTSRASPL